MSIIEGYKILKQIGKGSFGIVYEAENIKERKFPLKIGEKVAMKKLYIGDEYVMDDIRSEINILKNICNYFNKQKEHCNRYMASYIDTEIDGDYLYIITELIPSGLDLKQFIDMLTDKKLYKNSKECSEALYMIMINITKSLEFIHSKGIVHRDLKPANLMLYTDKVIIIDFGLSCMEKPIENVNKCRSDLAGSPNYIAPEIWQGKVNTNNYNKVDIFALGCIFYELTTGSFLFYGKSQKELSENIISNNHLPIETGNRALDILIEKMIDSNPDERPTPYIIYKFLEEKVESLIDKDDFKICK